MTWSPTTFAGMTDEQVATRRDEVGMACVRVMEMPEGERNRVGKKGEVSPAQAGAMSAMLFEMFDAECARRGLE